MLQDCQLSFLIFLNLFKATFGNFWSIRGNNCLNLMTQYRVCVYRVCIPAKYDVFVKHFYNFEERLRKCYHVTMNCLHFRFVAKLTQRWRNVIIPMSRKRCEFNVPVAILNGHYQYNIHGMLCSEFTIQR